MAQDVGPDDELFEGHSAKLVVDRKALGLIDGSELDFVRDGFKQLFTREEPQRRRHLRLRRELQRQGH